MKALFFVLFLVLAGQVVLFFVIRARKRKIRSEDVLFKYNIESRSDLWKRLNDPSIPEEDRKKLDKLYQKG